MRFVRSCAKAIIIRNEQILAVRYSDVGGEYYALPGGGQRHGETLPEALQRECFEELGTTVINRGLRFIREYIGKYGESRWRDADMHQVEFLFECELHAEQELGSGLSPDHDQIDLVWLPVNELRDYRFYPKALIAYLGRPFPDRFEYWGAVD